jgi:hypothetical protein
MAGDVIVTVTLNAALRVSYAAGDLDGENINPISRPSYRAAGLAAAGRPRSGRRGQRPAVAGSISGNLGMQPQGQALSPILTP